MIWMSGGENGLRAKLPEIAAPDAAVGKIAAYFKKRLRDEMKFGSKDELIDQIKRDIKNI